MISLRKQITKTSQSEMRDIAARICRDYLNGAWKSISAEEIQLRRISGGLSNFLYYVSLPDGYQVTPTSPIVANKRPRKDSDANNNNNNTKAIRVHHQQHQHLGEEVHHHEPKEVLLRIYGQSHGDHALEAMLTESVVFALLSERRLGPKLHGIFPGGRIEQYIPARPLKTGELAVPRISMKISEKMAEIHTLDIPVSKEPDWIWKTTDRWLVSIENVFNNNNVASGVTAEPDSAARTELKSRLRKIDFKKEVAWLREQLQDEVDFLVVFSHNDLQEGNILIRDQKRGRKSTANFADASETTLSDCEESSNRLDAILISSAQQGQQAAEKVNGGSRKRNKSSTGDEEEEGESQNSKKQLVARVDDVNALEDQPEDDYETDDEEEVELMIIDFEYCSYNYRGFDLANHFLEWTFDYTNKDYPFFFHKKQQFPNGAQKKAFLDTYLKTSHMIKGGSNELHVDEIVEQAERDLLEREIDFFKCGSHLFWSLWAIVYSDQEIEFGYWEYADCRLKEYFEAKETYLLRYKMNNNGSDNRQDLVAVRGSV